MVLVAHDGERWLPQTLEALQRVVLAVVLDRGLIGLSPTLVLGLIWLVAFTTVFSGVNYVWVWSHRAADYGSRQE